MPLIFRIATDMFEFTDVVDWVVNPVNLLGVSGAGLAAVFRDLVPKHIEPYRAACKSGELRIGTVQTFTDTDQPWGLINFPTKRHFQDLSEEADIKRGLIALRELLTQEQYRYSSIVMPMLGCGCGKQSYEIVFPMMTEYLSDLDATIFLSMAPDKTNMKPRYLTIAGPMDFGVTEDQQQIIDKVVDQALERKMDMTLSDYTGIVSGGYPGVDAYIGGTDFLKDEQETFVYRKTGKSPLVVKPNKARNGIGANLHQGNLLSEIADDVILFKPKGHNNNRLSAMQVWLQASNEERERNGLFPRRIAIYGDTTTSMSSDDLLVPQESDIPY